jgi:CBS domain-containing protein
LVNIFRPNKMATSQTEIESQAVELSAEAFEAFCNDISGMFGVDMACEQQEVSIVTIKDLKKHFKKLTAVNSVKAEGVVDGTFQLIFDQGGLFTLSGVIVMMPENRIREEIKNGTVKDTEAMNDTIGEAGNLLVGSWDRVFREGLEGHGHFAQSNSFIGKPWDEPEKTIGLVADGEFVFVPHEMTIGDYPAFKCGVIFPKTIFEPESDAEQAASAEEKPETEEVAAADDKAASTEQTAGETEKQEATATQDEVAADKKVETAQEEPKAEKADDTGESPTKEPSEADSEQKDTEASAAAGKEAAVTDETEESKEPTAGAVSETIQKMTESPAVLPGEAANISLANCAKDIMETDVAWGSSDDNVQQAIEKMQQADSGYMMVGSDGQLDGIVSSFDIAVALSVYLKPMFAKWRRPLDDATLQIKIKWIMSRPVRTITPETPLRVIMETMCQSGGRCLPVAAPDGKVQGIVTVFDILQAMLKNNDITVVGKTPQAPPLT